MAPPTSDLPGLTRSNFACVQRPQCDRLIMETVKRRHCRLAGFCCAGRPCVHYDFFVLHVGNGQKASSGGMKDRAKVI